MKTKKSCPISQLYSETGQWPARFEIKKARMFFLKTILDEDEKSMVAQFFKLQLEHPLKGDWVSTCKTDLKEMKIELGLNEIRIMAKDSFQKLVKTRMTEIALKYLSDKRGSKGKEIRYERLEMAEYLMPHNTKMSIEEKQNLFSIRNRMTEIGNNFGRKENCIMCGTNENMEHVYSCKYLNNNQENEISFGRIFNGYLIEQKKIMKIFEENLKRRNESKQNKISPCDPIRDPLNIFQFSNG